MGAAGALAARLLAGAGLRVVGVEAGGWTPGEEHFKRSLPWARRAADESAAAPADPAPMVNAVGGSNHRSGRQSYRLDLEAMPRRWPLNTAELVPYYERVEEAMTVQPSPPKKWTEAMRTAAVELDWEALAAPVATAPPLGHAELDPLIACGHLRVLTETIAVRLLCGDGGKAVGAEVRRARGVDEPERIHARRVILAAHTFENVRLLLLSRSATHPDGVGNSTGRVGAGFATHNLLSVHGHFPGQDLARGSGAAGHAVAVLDFDRGDGSILQAAMGASDPSRIAALTGLSAAAAHEVGLVWAQPEQAPRATNRLDLDPSRVDPSGRPLLVATLDLDDEDRRRADFLLARMAEWLGAAGASRTWSATPRANAISTHAYGGTEMGGDPVASVVDSFGEVHDAPGLFVVGGSTFPATGGRGPTETIEALAWRTADRIAAELTD
jgi:gluconate 2-dehydrogenase alpha chain